MYPLGFLPFFYSLVPEWGAVGFALVIPILVLALWFYTIVTRSASSTQPWVVRSDGFLLQICDQSACCLLIDR